MYVLNYLRHFRLKITSYFQKIDLVLHHPSIITTYASLLAVLLFTVDRSYDKTKGQLILYCPYEIIVSSKIPTQLFPGLVEPEK